MVKKQIDKYRTFPRKTSVRRQKTRTLKMKLEVMDGHCLRDKLIPNQKTCPALFSLSFVR